MAADLLFACASEDAELAGEVAASLEAAGIAVERRTDAFAPVTGIGLAVILVTRSSSGTPDLNAAIDSAAGSGMQTILAWWDEDAPSDFLSGRAAEDEVFYACFLPRPHRAAALVERVRAELGGG